MNAIVSRGYSSGIVELFLLLVLLYVVDPFVHTVVGSVFFFSSDGCAVVTANRSSSSSSRKRTKALSMMHMIWEDQD